MNDLPPGQRALFQVEALTGYEMLTRGHGKRPVGCIIMAPADDERGPLPAVHRPGVEPGLSSCGTLAEHAGDGETGQEAQELPVQHLAHL
jgi:hypothetical protein